LFVLSLGFSIIGIVIYLIAKLTGNEATIEFGRVCLVSEGIEKEILIYISEIYNSYFDLNIPILILEIKNNEIPVLALNFNILENKIKTIPYPQQPPEYEYPINFDLLNQIVYGFNYGIIITTIISAISGISKEYYTLIALFTFITIAVLIPTVIGPNFGFTPFFYFGLGFCFLVEGLFITIRIDRCRSYSKKYNMDNRFCNFNIDTYSANFRI